jgi:glycerol kinase
MIKETPDSETSAKRSTDLDEVYVVPAFSGLGAPYWDDEARGTVFGLTRGSNQDDFVKATLQSIAYQTKDVIETMSSDSDIPIDVLKVDGGASANDYLMQFQSDILNIPLERSAELETTSLGVAFLAGIGAGVWKDIDEIKQNYHAGQEFEPKMDSKTRDNLYSGWKDAVAATMAFKHTK